MNDANNLKEFVHKANMFAEQYLPECAADLLKWFDTAKLDDTCRFRELAEICAQWCGHHNKLGVAESLV
jgi:hypothetical protein